MASNILLRLKHKLLGLIFSCVIREKIYGGIYWGKLVLISVGLCVSNHDEILLLFSIFYFTLYAILYHKTLIFESITSQWFSAVCSEAHSQQLPLQHSFFWVLLIAKFTPFKIHWLLVVKFSCHPLQYSLVTRRKIRSSQNSLVTCWIEYIIIFPTEKVDKSEN